MPPPPQRPADFVSILEQIWWRLDAALDLEMLRWSAMLGALEALEAGTTAIVDHHESPSAIEGSLSVIAAACAEVGVRVSTAYGVTDRHGPDGARRGLAENERFLRAGGRGMVGVHAAFTCTDDTLEAAAGLARDLGVGVHIHVAEGTIDRSAGARLETLARPEWLLVHCVHLDRDLPGTIAHNPRSNMNNAVGYARPAGRPNPVVLGTDGIGADMLEEFRLAYSRHREDDVEAEPAQAWTWLDNGARLFPEVAGDTVVWDHDHADDPWWMAFTTGVRASDVTVGGEKMLSNGIATRVDAHEVRARAAEQARRLFARL
jgi:cytosine/adenosine deaminase-related metal-dependent hydrolase